MGYIAVDLDGTLAQYDGFVPGVIGEPIPQMVNNVKRWLADGLEVRIFTARVSGEGDAARDVPRYRKMIEDWTELHLGQRLAVTCCKDYNMEYLYDDRAIGVVANTGALKLFTSADMYLARTGKSAEEALNGFVG